MSAGRVAGILILVGLVLALAPAAVFPMEYYAATDQATRAAILSAHRSGWVAANWMWLVGSVATTAGLLLIALRDRSLLSMAGAALFVIGNAYWITHLYLRSLDASVQISGLWMEAVFAWLATVGLVLMGIALLRSDFPSWVGYVNIGYGVLFMLAFLAFGTGMYDFFPPQVIYLVALFAGVIALKRG